MPDGAHEPDYLRIEFSSLASFLVIINETKVTDEKVLRAYRGLSDLEGVIQSMVESGQPVDLAVVDKLLAQALPVEYQPLAVLGSKLIRQRAKLYLGEHVPDVDLGKYEVVAKIVQAVVSGARTAIEPKANAIKG